MKTERWTLENLKKGFENFYKIHERYPTTHEIDAFKDLPSSRQIQRKYKGGLPELRKLLKLNGPEDFTRGEHSSNRARTINSRAHAVENKVLDILVAQFGRTCVHREYFFTDDSRTRTDFYVFSKEGDFLVDVFYPKDRHNLIGCLNSKMRTYKDAVENKYQVIFLMMNDQIDEEEISKTLERKKNKIRSNYKVMTLGEFKNFIKNKHGVKS